MQKKRNPSSRQDCCVTRDHYIVPFFVCCKQMREKMQEICRLQNKTLNKYPKTRTIPLCTEYIVLILMFQWNREHFSIVRNALHTQRKKKEIHKMIHNNGTKSIHNVDAIMIDRQMRRLKRDKFNEENLLFVDSFHNERNFEEKKSLIKNGDSWIELCKFLSYEWQLLIVASTFDQSGAVNKWFKSNLFFLWL